MNATYTIETEEPEPEPEPEPTCVEGEPRPAGDGCNDCVCEGGEWACTDMACPATGDSSSSEGLSMVSWSAIIIGILAVLTLGVLFMRRSDGTEIAAGASATQTSAHAPCTSCGGPAHETINNGNRWTWCPSCRQWLNYLGKE